MKEQLDIPLTMSIEHTLNTLTERINRNKKSVLVVSDLDGTLANNHTFDSMLRVHVPNISRDLVDATATLSTPLLIATGRPDNDPTIAGIWRQLSRQPMPMIGENGGVIVSPHNNKVMTTINSDEFYELQETTTHLPNLISLLHENCIVPLSHEILIDSTRKTSIEVRIQDKLTKVGNPAIHQESSNFLRDKIASTKLAVICSGSSVSILPTTISKGKSVLRVLDGLGINRRDIFIVALGDADNDQSMFDMADMGIGVDTHTIGKSEITCLGGEKTSIEVIKAIGKLRI